MSSTTFIYTTIDDSKNAKKLAKALVEEKLAACVNIIPKIHSYYLDQDELMENEELVLIIKTNKKVIPWIKEFINQKHPYECPCVVELNVESVNEAFDHWVSRAINLK